MDANEEAIRTIDLFIDSTMKRYKSIFKASAKKISIYIIDNTPIYFEEVDTAGRTKANWNIALDSPDLSNNLEMTDRTGDTTKSKIRSAVQSMKLSNDSTIYLANTTPWILMLEYGMYPNPSKGSRNPVTGDLEVRTINGYSKQAPYGMVRINAARWQEIVREEAARKGTIVE